MTPRLKQDIVAICVVGAVTIPMVIWLTSFPPKSDIGFTPPSQRVKYVSTVRIYLPEKAEHWRDNIGLP